MAHNAFDFISFDEGIQRIENAWNKIGKKYDTTKVTTSRDEDVQAIADALKIEGMEEGFEKWQLPVYFSQVESQGAQFFITKAAPNARVSEHAHKDGDAIRFIVSGAVTFNGMELSEGDWMFIPRNVSYSLEIGSAGATMCYCYPCCCVPV